MPSYMAHYNLSYKIQLSTKSNVVTMTVRHPFTGTQVSREWTFLGYFWWRFMNYILFYGIRPFNNLKVLEMGTKI